VEIMFTAINIPSAMPDPIKRTQRIQKKTWYFWIQAVEVTWKEVIISCLLNSWNRSTQCFDYSWQWLLQWESNVFEFC
jgi:hypothetical protein